PELTQGDPHDQPQADPHLGVLVIEPDPRLGPIHRPMPDQRQARRRAMVMALICTGLAVWYLSWLLGGAHVGNPVLFGLLIAAESFNLVQAVGFWWTCSPQRMRAGRD